MSRTPLRSVCPRCRAAVNVPAPRMGAETPCPNCGQPFVPIPAGKTTLHRPGSPQDVAGGLSPLNAVPAVPARRRPEPAPAQNRFAMPLLIGLAVAAPLAVLLLLVVAAGVFLLVAYRQPQAAAPGATRTAPADPDKPPEVGKPYPLGDALVTVTGVSLDRVRYPAGRLPAETPGPLLQVRLRLKNASETRRVRYTSWSFSLMASDQTARLTDDFGNSYHLEGSGFARPFEGQLISEDVYPGKEVEDLIVFERPVEKASRLTLTLDGSAVDARGDLRYVFPRALWAKQPPG